MIYQNWVRGLPYVISESHEDYSGKYLLAVAGEQYELEVSGKPGSHTMKIKRDTTTITVKSKLDGELVTMSFKPSEGGTLRLSGYRDGNNWSGTCQAADGAWSDWTASYQGELGSGDRTATRGNRGESREAPEVGEVIYPFVAHGMKEMPRQENILIKNATVWTVEDDGILENTDVLIENGVISRIGANLSSQNARVIDGTGKHLTPGIVDEHSHLGASGINDRATNSSMVRIGDVINSDHIGLYRALAGGVTTIQILHGSANPIGGQSALIKLRWGASPEGLKIQGADGFIKFALGENVKRSTSDNSIRYPQTRMGVEQVMVDAFTNALEYQDDWEAF
ncbi:MAG: amidohydrolase, partial [Saprospiraceae bacterium]|nr:amidohydrolase [Saprospiraceae bacterium]